MKIGVVRIKLRAFLHCLLSHVGADGGSLPC